MTGGRLADLSCLKNSAALGLAGLLTNQDQVLDLWSKKGTIWIHTLLQVWWRIFFHLVYAKVGRHVLKLSGRNEFKVNCHQTGSLKFCLLTGIY